MENNNNTPDMKNAPTFEVREAEGNTYEVVSYIGQRPYRYPVTLKNYATKSDADAAVAKARALDL